MLLLTLMVVLVAIASVLIGLFAFIRNPRDKQNITFFAFTVLLGVWTIFNYAGSNYIDERYTTFLVLSDFATGVLLAASFWLFTRVMYAQSQKRGISRNWILVYLVLAVVIALASFAGLVVKVAIQNNDLLLTNQALYPLYAITVFIYLGAGILSLIVARLRSKGQARQQFSIILFGLVVASILVAVPNLIIPLFLDNSWIKTFTENLAYFGIFFFAAMISYAIAKHRLFDIRFVVARSVAYSMLLGTLGLIYGFTVFSVSSLLFDGEVISGRQQAVYIVLAIFLAFTFQPLRRFFEKLTDKIFYRDKYETQEVLNKINSILTSQIDLGVITNTTLTQICSSLKILDGQFIVLDEDSIYQKSTIGTSSTVKYSDLLRLNRNLILGDELEVGSMKDLLHNYGITVSLRLKTQEGVVGYILLGPKQNGSIYTEQDIKLLEILGDELAIAVQNARSFEKIADFNVTLQRRIEEATKRLRVQNRKLKELDEAKDEFISMASHQLRTPLTSIKGYLSMLEEGDGGKLSKKQFDFADAAYVSAQRMVFLISDMLNVSRINTGKLVIEKAPLDLDAVVKDEVKQLQRTSDSRNVKLVYSVPKEKIPLLSLDEGKIRQVIMNFMDNAIYYAPETTVEVFLELVDGKVRFSVKDHGIGVPKEAQKHLFTKFYRAENAQRSRPDGTGLGLFMAKMVVEMQGGSIIFHSEEGKGSTFGFEFPMELVQASSTAAATKATAITPSR